jgi:hypothetical protein
MFSHISHFIKQFHLFSLAIYEHGSFYYKIMHSIALAVVLSPVFLFVSRFTDILFKDTLVYDILIILLIVNTISGMVKHFMKRTFSWKDLAVKLMLKTLVCLIGIALFNTMNTIADGSSLAKSLFEISSQSVLFLYIGGDTFTNLHYISGGKFPPASFMNRFKNFENPDSNEPL